MTDDALMQLLHGICEQDDLEAAKQLMSDFQYPTDTFSVVMRAFIHAGAAKSFSWCVKNASDRYLRTLSLEEMFCYAAQKGQLEICKWLLNGSGYAVDPAYDSNLALRMAASEGHLEVVKWLCTCCGQIVDATAKSNAPVRAALSHLHFEVAEWLVGSSGQCVNVTDAGNDALVTAVLQNQLEVLKWLVEESSRIAAQNPVWKRLSTPVPVVDPSMNTNFALRRARQDGFEELVRWLLFESGCLPQLIAAGGIDEFLTTDLQAISKLIDGHQKAEMQALQQRQLRERKLYINSAACRKAVDSGLVQAYSQLETLEATANPPRVRREL